MDKKRAVLYLRYSSNSQSEQSIEGQRRICRDYADREGIEIIREYVDRATSASHDTQRRVSFQAMISDARHEDFDFVLVYKLDRFSRDRYDFAHYKAKLKEHGIRVISATEALTDSPESIILESLLEGMAEYYSRELSQKVKRGMRESAEKRLAYGAATPIGLMVVDQKYVPDPSTKWIVEKAFRDYAAGSSLKTVAKSLSDLGARGQWGKKLGPQTIARMLHNEKYCGVYKYKDEIYDSDAIEPIVSREIYDKVQAKLAANAKLMRRKPKAPEDESLLKGKLFCGKCGASMVPSSGTSRNGDLHRYYRCGKRLRKSDCDKRGERKEVMEKAVLEDATRMLTDELIERIADLAVDALGRPADEIGSLKKQIAQTETQIENFTSAIGQGIISQALLDKLQQAEQSKAEMLDKLSDLEAQRPAFSKEQIEFYLFQLKGQLDDPDFAKRLIDTFVERVEVYDDPDDKNSGHLIIKYRLLDSSMVRLSSQHLRHL